MSRQALRRAGRRLSLWLPVLAVAALLLALNLWAARHLGRVDLTAQRLYSLTPESIEVARQIRQPVDVTWFYDLRNKSMVDALELLRQYEHANPLIRVRGVDPALRPADARAAGIQFAGSAVLASDARKLTINGGTETDFTNALIRISQNGAQTVCFTQGHREATLDSLTSLDDLEEHDGDENLVARVEVHEQHGLAMARNALQTLGYATRSVNAGGLEQALPRCAVVVAAGPRTPFGEDDAQALRRWTNAGGKTLLLLEPDTPHGLDPLLRDFGIARPPGALADPGSHYRNDPGSPAVSDYTRHKMTRGLPLSFFPGAAGLEPAGDGLPPGVVVTPLAQTSAEAHLPGQPPSRYTLMALATRNAQAGGADGSARPSLLVAGDSDFAVNRHFATLGNGALFTNAVTLLAGEDALLAIRPRHYENRRVELTNRQMRAVFWTSTVALPLLALMAGLLLWWRRR
ncbi:GldG family protein [Achromobacter deleyi]|uniref:GldG family protein n=1 Tax=Achromobacter deleyi TaxID=1353891 RepID=UPI00149221F8|nr:GldG family protein [Achromobacter deleyi]QVQ26119.1 GldG family protein [Achromobacter deleyi]UIP21679.1 GldG family protein [Achromobacter deleyi]